MASLITNRRRRNRKILRLFLGLLADFMLRYLRAKLTGTSYDFFEDSERNRIRAVRIRTAAIEMGGVLIKIGQFLSSRVDLLPSEYIEELALLQDEVPGVPLADIRAVVELELGEPLEELFAEFNPEPIAAASLGQVHRARLPAGERVAVKVQRPRIEEIVEADLQSIRRIVGWLDRFGAIRKRVDLPQVLREFEVTLRVELDYVAEGHHAERIAYNMRAEQAVAIPRVYWSHSTRRVLALEDMWGTKITDFPALEAQGIDRPRLAEVLMRAYLKQVLDDGFFHADPHPGNLFVRPGPVVVFLDFGMVGEIPPEVRGNLRLVFLGVVRRDFDEVIAALMRLGFVPRNADVMVLRRALQWTVDTFYEMSLGDLKTISPAEVLDRLQEVFFTQSVRVPPNYAFLGRALGTLSGLCTALDPSFQFVTVAEPFARRLLSEDLTPGNVIRTVLREGRLMLTTAYRLPHLTRDVLEGVERGELNFRHEFDDVVRSIDNVERAMGRLLYGLLVTGFMVAGAFIFPTHRSIFGLAAFAVALFFLLGVLSPFRARR